MREYLGLIIVVGLAGLVALWVLWLVGRIVLDARRADPDARRLVRASTEGATRFVVVALVALGIVVLYAVFFGAVR